MTATGRYLLEAQLPQGLTCSQCVIQWKWHTGKHWVNTGYAVVIRCIILQANSMRNQNKFDSLVKITVYKWLKVKQVGQSFFFMISGNNFGFGPDGRSCKGCGPQEEFYGCADVTIISKTTSLPQVQTSLPPNTPRPVVIIRPTETQPPPVTAKPTTTTTTTPVPTTTETVMTSSVKPTSGSGCRAINLWAGNPTLDKWCISNCAKGNCPSSACACS